MNDEERSEQDEREEQFLTPRPNALCGVNVCRCAYKPAPAHWAVDLHSTDGTVWTLEQDLTQEAAMFEATRFGRFSGLPVYLHGNPI